MAVRKPALITAAFALALLAVGLLVFDEPVRRLLIYINSGRSPAAVPVFALLVLPMVLFPVTPLLILIGLRFDSGLGTLIMFLVMPIHLSLSFMFTRRWLRRRMQAFARKIGYRHVTLPRNRHFEFSLLFMAVPGLPYAVKNYLLPVSNISFRTYLATGWLAQGVMGIPFVVLGDAAAAWSAPLFIAFVLLLLITAAIARLVRKRLDRMNKTETDR
jgi:uncharacterized membrane protein YdjX (TVP38/TMEM64 family)